MSAMTDIDHLGLQRENLTNKLTIASSFARHDARRTTQDDDATTLLFRLAHDDFTTELSPMQAPVRHAYSSRCRVLHARVMKKMTC